jgi:chromosome partitioning protein
MTLGATVRTVGTLRDLGATFKTLLTILPPPPSHDGDEARAFLREQKIPTFKGGIRRAVAFQKASLAGVPVYEVPDPRAEMAWADNAAIGKEIIA